MPKHENDEEHDWRVDPSQVIIMVASETRFRVVCPDPECLSIAQVYTQPCKPIVDDNPLTWRPYRKNEGDRLVVIS